MSCHISEAIWQHSTASGTAKFVLLALGTFANEQTKLAWPSNKALRDLTGLSESQVRRALQKLERGGHIEFAGSSEEQTRVYKVVIKDVVVRNNTTMNGHTPVNLTPVRMTPPPVNLTPPCQDDTCQDDTQTLNVSIPLSPSSYVPLDTELAFDASSDAVVSHEPPLQSFSSGEKRPPTESLPQPNRLKETSANGKTGDWDMSPETPSAKQQRRSQVPPDWTPSEGDLSWSATKKFSRQEVERETERFINHHRSKGNLFLDHGRAWRNWMDNSRRYAASNQARPMINKGGTGRVVF